MRHFDAWVIRDPYSIWHYYPTQTSSNWTNTVRDLVISRQICSPTPSPSPAINPYTPPPNPQSQSPLSRLPPEIRSMIWSYVFPPATLHLVTIKNKLRHIRCQAPNLPSELTHHRHCCPTTPARWRVYDGRVPGHSDRLLYPHTHEQLPDLVSDGNVALLRTCRAIYAETADVLYRNSTIDVDDLYTFIAFCESIPLRARNAIRRLTVQWMPVWEPLAGLDHKGSIYAHTHSDALWTAFWARVAGLDGLKELGLSVDLGRFTGTKLPLVLKERWLLPLLNVRGLTVFELAVTARCDEAAKGVIESGLVRDAAVLRDQLRAVMCSDVGVNLADVEGLEIDFEMELGIKEPLKGRQGPLMIEA
ncbi:uncharacterized protein N7477_001100 [Penicillium maclennaniae]|uniref:uncharacterized protein n=1 Tax=Penicillium maclennaniae TaxID=1343394 RepID=UPI00254017C0|nr:uncharacterized protein N7477_001100 [Penicillium maclennaniae]KAJ5684755.1 hypothetical protein N7477_001100 [Penicillium maclennaniae]